MLYTVIAEAMQLENLKYVQSSRIVYRIGREQVLGYFYVSGSRSGRADYKQTIELSLFCSPEHLYIGTGTTLLKRM